MLVHKCIVFGYIFINVDIEIWGIYIFDGKLFLAYTVYAE